jgi:hypothetical protein
MNPADMLKEFIKARRGNTVILHRVCPLCVKIHDQVFYMKNDLAHHIGVELLYRGYNERTSCWILFLARCSSSMKKNGKHKQDNGQDCTVNFLFFILE